MLLLFAPLSRKMHWSWSWRRGRSFGAPRSSPGPSFFFSPLLSSSSKIRHRKKEAASLPPLLPTNPPPDQRSTHAHGRSKSRDLPLLLHPILLLHSLSMRRQREVGGRRRRRKRKREPTRSEGLPPIQRGILWKANAAAAAAADGGELGDRVQAGAAALINFFFLSSFPSPGRVLRSGRKRGLLLRRHLGNVSPNVAPTTTTGLFRPLRAAGDGGGPHRPRHGQV